MKRVLIALSSLRRAKVSWKALGRDVSMKALLVEKSLSAFKKLSDLQTKYPDIEIVTINADFRDSIGRILHEIPSNAFAFFLIDPMGWRIPMRKIAPLLQRQKSEILFNFMFDFINRAASMDSPATVSGLDELLPIGKWRTDLRKIQDGLGDDRTTARKIVLIDAFRDSLRELGGYRYVADIPVMRPIRDRLLYSLVYATRRAEGIEVFRDCQIKTLNEQDAVRSATKAKATGSAGQGEMFSALEEMGPDATQAFLRSERVKAQRLLMDLVPQAPEWVTWDQLWPQVLAQYSIRLTELKAIAVDLRRNSQLLFPDWEEGRRVPQSGYRVQRR